MLKKSIVTVATITVVGFSSAFFHSQVQAEPVSNVKSHTEIQNDREAIKANLSDAEAKIADILIDLEDLNKEINQVNKAMKENNKQMEKAKSDIAKKEQERAKLEAEIKKLEEAIEKRYSKLKERAVSYQESGGDVSYLEVVLGSKSFGEFINRVSAVNKITDADVNLMEEQEKDKKEVEKKKEKVQASLQELQALEKELKGMQDTIAQQKQENDKKKDKLQTKKDELVSLKDELKVKDSNLAALEAEVRQNIAANIDDADTSSNRATTEESRPAASVNNNSNGGDLQTVASKQSNNQSSKQRYSSKPKSSGGGGLSAVLNAGYPYLGKPYVWGGKSPESGFDCSGFVSWAFAQGGYSIPSNTGALAGTGQKVKYSQIQPGDIVFFDTYKTNGHVGIYIGGGQFIGAQDNGLSVASMSNSYWKKAFKGHVRRVR
ncbi:C40 family peptidase [Virgibacillus proomii]|jgi:peptidoglycan DL-endopeptidase CwlO|uniref:C40 family peptidase n=1 Tax=Virgibacillus proomii TaxID=84407 RepID=UPI0009863C78|nr:C40 family peptidase [Virgibacillus proomii]